MKPASTAVNHLKMTTTNVIVVVAFVIVLLLASLLVTQQGPSRNTVGDPLNAEPNGRVSVVSHES